MKPLIVMGIRTIAHLESKDVFYAQIEAHSICARPRFPEEHVTALSETYALGILSSHSIAKILCIIAHLGWSHLFPEDHLISSDGLDRKDPANWSHWRNTFGQRGLDMYAVVDIGDKLVCNLARVDSFNSVLKYHVTDNLDTVVEGVTTISGLDQTTAYREILQKK